MSNQTEPSLVSLWRQFLPLSVSDVTMACGDPLISTTLARLPSSTEMLSAVGVAKALVVVFESPIIMILHASNTLAESQRSRQALWRFVLIACVTLTALLGLLTVPPVFAFVAGTLMSVPSQMIELARTALLFLLLWPATICIRRYFQGLLIHAGHVQAVAHAGLLRLGVVGAMLTLGFYSHLSGVDSAGLALILGVMSETVVVLLAAKRYKVTKRSQIEKNSRLPQNVAGVWKFYWPLANSMLVVWLGRALLLAVIARSEDASLALAVWPAAWGFILVVANATRMVQQVVIKNRGKTSDERLTLFAASVGLAFSFVLGSIACTSVGHDLIHAFAGHNSSLAASMEPVVLICVGVPLVVALQNALQGLLISEGHTDRVNLATWLGTLVLIVGAIIGIGLGLSGATSAAVAMISGLVCEVASLALSLRQFYAQTSKAVRRVA